MSSSRLLLFYYAVFLTSDSFDVRYGRNTVKDLEARRGFTDHDQTGRLVFR